MPMDTPTLPITPEQIEGPYWLPGSPLRHCLNEPDAVGNRVEVSGTVRTMTGNPIADAWVDV
jgi:protocatechuate 3,4-dioxygenase beta subunit